MPRSMVGLLAAVGTAMSAFVAFAHGSLIWVTIVIAAAATGLAAVAASPLQKNSQGSQKVTLDLLTVWGAYYGAGSPRAYRTWPSAWPSSSGPLGRQRLQGQRRAAAPPPPPPHNPGQAA
jgi:hypothetical protein